MAPLDHFAADYAAARAKFRAACAAAGVEVAGWPHPLKGINGEALATDTAWIGPADARRVLVTCSGTHGVEGFYGSACQVGWLREGGPAALPGGTAVLAVHATNPYGFSWMRRVNEDNIDINRNFLDFDRPLPVNRGYLDVAAWLEPRDWNAGATRAIATRLADYAAAHGARALSAAVSAGQHTHPHGLFYGGTGPCWSNRTMGEVVSRYLDGADHVCVIDFHTGLGPYGESEIICRHPTGSEPLALARRWFGAAVTSPEAGESESPVIEGNLRMAFTRWLPEATVVAAAIEVGTLPAADVQTALLADNWLHTHGDPESDAGRRIQRQLRDAFYPDRDNWRDRCYPRAQQIQRAALAGLAAI